MESANGLLEDMTSPKARHAAARSPWSCWAYPQRVGRGYADRQVIRSQVLQGAPRLANDGFRIVLNDRQGRADRGNLSYEVPRTIVCSNGPRKRGFSSLEFRFDGSMSAAEKQRRGISDPQRGPGIQYRRWQ
jgi:hypothetical protein